MIARIRVPDPARPSASDAPRGAGAPRPTPFLRRSMPDWLEVLVQFGLVFGAALLYFGVRGLTEGDPARAIAHAERVLDLERWLGIDVEIGLQNLILEHHWLVTLSNWVYIWAHWPVIGLSLFWLHHRHRREYLLLRNTIFVSGAIGLVIFAVYPVAPPRLMSMPIVDTVTDYSHSYRVFQPPSLVNKYAALPSLHAGWNVYVALVVARVATGRLVRLVTLAVPVAMCVAVVSTGNHYVIDVVAGVAVGGVGYLVAGRVLAPLYARSRPRLGRALGAAPATEGVDQLDVVEDEAVDAGRDQAVGLDAVARAPRPHEGDAAV